MPDLLFLEDSHRYILDGAELPSVSTLCAPLHNASYQDAPKWQMEAAAERGTAVHLATVQLEQTGQAQTEESYAPYVRAYAAFLSEHEAAWSLTEQPLYHPELLFAGTPDRYGLLDGKATIVDVKTTYAVQKPLVRAQLNLYRLLLLAKGLPVEKLTVLHLKPDGTYKLVPVPMDEPLALALITVHNALPKRRKKGATHV